MNSKILQQSALGLALLASCGRNEPPKAITPLHINKTEEAKARCQNFSLFADMELSGSYLEQVIGCASNQSSAGEESLDHILKVSQKLGAEGMQTLLDFILSPSPNAISREERYPYLTVMKVVMERGIRGQDPSLNLSKERLDLLQPFLLQLNISRSLELMDRWQSSGELAPILEGLSQFISQLEDGSLSALSQELLAGKTIRPHLLPFAIELLGKRSLMKGLEDTLSQVEGISLYRLPQQELASNCLESWLDSVPRKQKRDCLEASQPEAEGGDLGIVSYQSFLSQLGDQGVDQLSAMVFSILQAYQGLDDDSISLNNHSLAEILDQLISNQEAPGRYLLTMLHQLSTSDAADLNLVAEAAEKVLDSSFDPTLNKLRSKIGSSHLIDYAHQLIMAGGPIESCQNLKLRGLMDLPATAGRPSLEKLLSSYLSPHPQCLGIPPLASAMSHRLGITVSAKCLGQLNCIDSQSMAMATGGQDFWQDSLAEDKKLNQDLLLKALQDARLELAKDPYYLWHWNLSSGPLEPEDLDPLIAQAQSQPGLSSKAIATFDLNLEEDAELFLPRFHERLLAISIRNLAATAEQFSQLMPVDNQFISEGRAARVFSGLYPEGPMTAVIKTALTSDKVREEMSDAKLKSSLADNPDRLASFLFRFKQSGSIFKESHLPTLGNSEHQTFLLGSNVLNYVGIQEEGELFLKNRNTVSLKQVFTDKSYLSLGLSENWGLWSKHLYSGGLTIKDIPLSIGQQGPQGLSAFEIWSATEALSNWQKVEYWQEPLENAAASHQPLDARFFSSKPYSLADARMIALYYMTHYLKAPLPKLPKEQVSIAGSSTYNSQEPWRAFTNLGFLSDPTKQLFPWKIYYNTFPELLKQRYRSLEELQGHLLPSLEEIGEGEFFGRRFTYRRNRSMEQFGSSSFPSESLKTFSTLNLLSFAGDRSTASAMPAISFAGKYCYLDSDSNSPPLPCPVEFGVGGTVEEGYQQVANYLAQTLALKLCPLISSDPIWHDRLGLSLDSPESCQFPSDELYHLDSIAIPDWYGQAVLEDIFALGKDPQLKPELGRLPSKIRLARLELEPQLSSMAKRSLWLRDNLSPASQYAGAYDWNQQLSAFNMWSGQSSLLQSYSGLISQVLGKQQYDLKTRELALTISGNTRPVVRELLSSFVSKQKTLAASGGTALELFLEMGQLLRDDDVLRQAAIHLIHNHSSPTSYEFLAIDLPAAVQGLFGFTFNWADKGLLLTRFAVNRDVLFSLHHLLNSFSGSSLDGASKSILNSLQHLGTPKEAAQTLGLVANLLVELGLRYDPQSEGLAVDLWDSTAKIYLNTKFSTDAKLQLAKFIGNANSTLTDLEGREVASFTAISQGLAAGLLKNLANIVMPHSRSTPKAANERGFWSALALDLLQPLKENGRGAKSLSGLLADERLGFTDGLWEASLQSQSTRVLIDNALSSVAQVSKDDWLKASDQSRELLPRLSPLLSYLDRKGQWSGDGAEEFKDSVTTFLNLSENREGLLDRQTEVINHWLTGTPNLY